MKERAYEGFGTLSLEFFKPVLPLGYYTILWSLRTTDPLFATKGAFEQANGPQSPYCSFKRPILAGNQQIRSLESVSL